MPPLVSICIPTFNGALYLEEALESVINQTYGHLELVVSDDASSDETLDIFESFKNKTSIPLRIYHHQPNGIGANWNHCIRHAKGLYIKFLFQDDVLLPTCVEDMVNLLESDTSIMMVASKRTLIYEPDYEPEFVSEWTERFGDLQKSLELQYKQGICVLDKELFRHKQFLRSPLNKIGEPTTIMFRKHLIDKIGYYREDLKQILDYEFCYRALKQYSIAIIDKPLVKFRLHSSQASIINKTVKSPKENEGYSKILYKEFLEYLDPYMKKHIIKKHHPLLKVLYAIKARIKKLLK